MGYHMKFTRQERSLEFGTTLEVGSIPQNHIKNQSTGGVNSLVSYLNTYCQIVLLDRLIVQRMVNLYIGPSEAIISPLL